MVCASSRVLQEVVLCEMRPMHMLVVLVANGWAACAVVVCACCVWVVCAVVRPWCLMHHAPWCICLLLLLKCIVLLTLMLPGAAQAGLSAAVWLCAGAAWTPGLHCSSLGAVATAMQNAPEWPPCAVPVLCSSCNDDAAAAWCSMQKPIGPTPENTQSE